jgi:hypothetical protein
MKNIKQLHKIILMLLSIVTLAFWQTELQAQNSKTIKAKTGKVKKIPKSDRIDLAMQQEFELTKDPATNRVPRERLTQARNFQLQKFTDQPLQRAAPGYQWEERGPNNVGGRTRALLYDKNDATNKKVWAGSVGGGLWVCSDITLATPVWNKVNDFAPNLAVTTIAQHPTSPLIMYYGTGEGWFNADAIQGLGIYKSTNGGATWTQLASTTGSTFNFVQKIMVGSNGNVYACTRNAGVQRSTDGGVTWTTVLSNGVGGGSTTRAADIEINSTGNLFASLGIFSTGQIFRSTDFGTTWTNITPTGTWQRIELATCPSNTNRVYALLQGTGNGIGGLRRTDNANAVTPTWTTLGIPSWCDQGSPSTDFTRTQCWYDLIAQVDPLTDATVYIGGVDVLKSTNSGTSWTQVTQWASGCTTLPVVHADIHAITFKPGSSSELLVGCDGGIYRTINTGTAFSTRNNGYNVTQFYASAINPTVTNNFLAGAQDNGTQRFTTAGINATTMATGGDGAFCHIDQDNQLNQISSYVFNNYFISTNGGTSFTQKFLGNTGQFINPTDYDNTANILYAGANAGQYFRSVFPLTTGTAVTVAAFGAAKITHVMVANSVANRVYFGFDDGKVIRVNNANGTPVAADVKVLRPAGGGSVSCIALDPNSATENRILVTYSNYGVTSVFLSTDANTALVPTWASREGDLPDMPVRWAMFDPRNSNWALLATELGVWSTDDITVLATDWEPTNNNFANVRVDQFQFRASDKLIAAATHGRGLYTTKVPADLFIKDDPADVAIEPNPLASGVFWNSPDIWVCNTGFGATCLTHSNPIGSNPNTIRIRVNNRGSQTSNGTEKLKVYWAKASTGLGWPDAWIGTAPFVCTPPKPTGALIGTINIPAGIVGGGSQILSINWTPPDPSDYNCFGADKSHFCILARIETETTAPFGMTFPETTDLWLNTKNNNNIAWKNVSITDLNPAGPGIPPPPVLGQLNTTVLLAGEKYSAKNGLNTAIKFLVPQAEINNNILNYAAVHIDLGQFYTNWKANGMRGTGFVIETLRVPVYINQTEYTFVTKDLLRIIKPDAYIDGVDLAPGTIGPIGVMITQTANYPLREPLHLDVIQNLGGNIKEIVGGETFEFVLMETAPAVARSIFTDVNAVPENNLKMNITVDPSSKMIKANETEEFNSKYFVEVWDANGRQMLNKTISGNVEINGTGWSSGIYIVRILNTNNRKIVVKRIQL